MTSSNHFDTFESQLELPVDQHKRSILYLLEKHRILIVIGETGSGKSTRIPQILFQSGLYNDNVVEDDNQTKVICITQTRRTAAMQLAQRVAQDLKCNLGSTVGYAVRFKDVTDANQTMIKFMTEGLLVREMLYDPLLTKYSVIIVDEVHERNLNTDILLGLLKCIMVKRKDLRLIICSATLNTDDVCKFYTYSDVKQMEQDECLKKPAVLSVQGKIYPVEVFYLQKPVANYMEASIETVINIHETNRLASGKILVFLTGQDEVDYVCGRLDEYAQTNASRLDLKKLMPLPLHASLKPDEISRVFETVPRNTRVCIISTNVAETSLTIDDVAFVIDCGFVKLKFYDHKTGLDALVKVPISKSSAKQRAGRAGRTRNGAVYRLYPESEYENLSKDTEPEIQRSSLTETIMLLKSLGISNLLSFPLVSQMPRENLITALEVLYALQAIDDCGKLTVIGESMARFNLDPKLSKVLVSLDTSACTIEACRIVAMLQVKDIYVKTGKYASSLWSNTQLTSICVSEGDLPTYLNIFNGFVSNNKNQRWAEKRNLNHLALLNVVDIAEKIETQLRRCGVKLTSCNGRLETIQKSVVSGLFSNAAYLHPSGDYRTIRGEQTVHIHPTSIYSEMLDRPKYVVFVEILHTTKPYIRHLMSIESKWLLDAAPHFFTFATDLEMQRII